MLEWQRLMSCTYVAPLKACLVEMVQCVSMIQELLINHNLTVSWIYTWILDSKIKRRCVSDGCFCADVSLHHDLVLSEVCTCKSQILQIAECESS